MTQPHTVTTSFQGMPLEYDILDNDLEPHFKELEGRPLYWGLCVGAVANAWTEEGRLIGIDWSIDLHTPKDLRVPLAGRSPTGRMRWKRVPRHCALIAVTTGKDSVNPARDVGRPAVRALLAIARREIPLLLPSDIIWEGFLTRGPNKIGMSLAEVQAEAARPATPERINTVGLSLARLRIGGLPSHVIRSLQWLALARASQVRADRFIHMWLGVLSLASYGRPVSGADMSRISDYVRDMARGIAGVVSQTRVDRLIDLFRRASNARNRLMHRDDASRITGELLEDLEKAAFELIDFEFRKANMAGIAH